MIGKSEGYTSEDDQCKVYSGIEHLKAELSKIRRLIGTFLYLIGTFLYWHFRGSENIRLLFTLILTGDEINQTRYMEVIKNNYKNSRVSKIIFPQSFNGM